MEWLQLDVSFSFCNDLKLFQIAGLLRQMSISVFAYFTSGMTSFGVRWVKLSSFFLDSHRNKIFFSRENVSFCALSKVFPDESHRNAQHFLPFLERIMLNLFAKFSQGASLTELPKLFLFSTFAMYARFSKPRDLSKPRKTRGPFWCPNRGMVQTEEVLYLYLKLRKYCLIFMIRIYFLNMMVFHI